MIAPLGLLIAHLLYVLIGVVPYHLQNASDKTAMQMKAVTGRLGTGVGNGTHCKNYRPVDIVKTAMMLIVQVV